MNSSYKSNSMLLAFFLCLTCSFFELTASEIPARAFQPIREITVQYNGRYMPLDSMAREVVSTIAGSDNYQQTDAVELIMDWTVNALKWQKKPLISINNQDLRRHLELSETKRQFSFTELISHKPLHALVDQASNKPNGEKKDALELKVLDIEKQIVALQQIFMGTSIRIIPSSENSLAAWQPLSWLVKNDSPDYAELKKSWFTLAGSYKGQDADLIFDSAEAFQRQLNALPAKFRPSKKRITRELHYNRLAPYTKAWILMLVGTVISLASVFIKKRITDIITIVFMMAGFCMLSYGIYLRWMIAGRIPASNMFESLLFLSWGAAAFTILGPFLLKNRMVTLTGAFIAGLSLMLGDVLPINAYIRPVAPVLLDTFWMAVHVPVIMISYSVLAISMLVAHVQIIGMGIFGKRWKFEKETDTFLYWYMFSGSLLLIVGILTGSMWAASSWGRYWGWDPKEVWSLVAFLGYMAIMHIRIQKNRSPKFLMAFSLLLGIGMFIFVGKQLAPLNVGKVISLLAIAVVMVYFLFAASRFATAAKNILSFWLIIMTYVGVNYILGTGLHSYGFGAGVAARGMFLTGGIDLVLVGICLLAYYLRNNLTATSAAEIVAKEE